MKADQWGEIKADSKVDLLFEKLVVALDKW